MRIGLFGLLFLYVVIRAIWNEPLHDEIASFYFFFYHGDYIGSNLVVDANNHLINSFFGNLTYRLFGDHFFLFRLPNVLSLLLYFWAANQITVRLADHRIRFLALLALCCSPYLLDYFAYARGYGMSMAFFLAALHFYCLFHSQKRIKHLWFTYALFWLGLSANLTLINSSLLCIGIVGLFVLLHKDYRVIRWKTIGVSLVFIFSIIPFVLFSFLLKNGGALYYGNMDGLWGTTGATLAKYTLNLTAEWSWLIISLFLLVPVLVVGKKFLSDRWHIFSQPVGVFTLLFFGNLLGTLILALFLEVNYPEDRTAMYLWPLFVLMLAFSFNHLEKWGVAFSGIFLYVPILLVAQLNLHTSVFSPDDRMTNEFYSEVKKELKLENSLSLYGIMSWNWPRHESHAETKSPGYNLGHTNKLMADVIVSKTTILNNPIIPLLYDTIAADPPSTYVALKRKPEVPIRRKEILSMSVPTISGEPEYANIWGSKAVDSLRGHDLQMNVSGHLKTFAEKNYLVLTYQIFNGEGAVIDYGYYDLGMVYNSRKMDHDITHHMLVHQLSDEAEEIRVFIWNRQPKKFEFSEGQFSLQTIEALPEHLKEYPYTGVW